MSAFSVFRFLLLVSCLSAAVVLAAVPGDEVSALPGWSGKLPSKHYSGYFPTTLDGSTTSGGMLHYYLTLSENDPTKDPLVVWLQGGPGCSSLYGMLYENGQLHFSGQTDNSTGVPQLIRNDYAWTKVASMLWLEQPVGVGFSYCLNDNCTCDYEGCPFGIDAYNFFVNFFKGYPELAKLDFHISGESYGGVYVPYIADAVLTGNAGGKNAPINLKGILIGNGVGGDDDESEELRRESDFFYGHAAFSYQKQLKIAAVCGYNGTVSSECQNAIADAESGVGEFYIYNFYDTCPHDLEAVRVADLSDDDLARVGLFAPIGSRSVLKDLGFVCVLESVSSDYLNTHVVQQAIHVTQANVTTWGPCGNSDAHSHSRQLLQQHRDAMRRLGMMAPNDSLGDLYKKLIAEIPVLIYSGDVDQCVPYYYSDGWVRRLGWSVKEDWKVWNYGSSDNTQVGGYVTTFNEPNGLTFLTIKDAGHMVPLYAPEAALTFFTRYLTKTPY